MPDDVSGFPTMTIQVITNCFIYTIHLDASIYSSSNKIYLHSINPELIEGEQSS